MMYFIPLIAIIYLCWGSNTSLALLIKNHWFISWVVYSVAYSSITYFLKVKKEQKQQAEYEAQLQARFNYLIDKYGDENIARMIMDRAFWLNQTEEQLLESIGQPYTIEDKVLKTKRKQIWRYGKINARSFELSIVLENGIVVGWDKR